MLKIMPEADFEAMVERIYLKYLGYLPRDKIREQIKETAKLCGIIIVAPLVGEVQNAQVRAGEEAVVEPLKNNSLVQQIRLSSVGAGENMVLRFLQEKGLE